jgi:hypothetical protein
LDGIRLAAEPAPSSIDNAVRVDTNDVELRVHLFGHLVRHVIAHELDNGISGARGRRTVSRRAAPDQWRVVE